MTFPVVNPPRSAGHAATGLTLSLVVLAPTAFWCILVASRLFRLR